MSNDLNKLKINTVSSKYYYENNVYLGGSSNKKVIIDRITDNRYMIKFEKVDFKIGSPYNDHIAEFLGSNIITLLGYESQNAYLVRNNNVDAVLVELFSKPMEELSNKVNYFYSMNPKYLDLDNILREYRIKSYINNIDKTGFNNFLIKMVLVDYVIINIDRHPGNVGFFRENGVLYPAPFYDSGASLLTRYFSSNYKQVIRDHSMINYKVKYKNKQITFKEMLEILSTNQNSIDYRNEINTILRNYKLNRNEIHKLIDTIILLNKDYKNITEYIKYLLDFTTKELEKLLLEPSNGKLEWM